jgi:hypothetical protein
VLAVDPDKDIIPWDYWRDHFEGEATAKMKPGASLLVLCLLMILIKILFLGITGVIPLRGRLQQK